VPERLGPRPAAPIHHPTHLRGQHVQLARAEVLRLALHDDQVGDLGPVIRVQRRQRNTQLDANIAADEAAWVEAAASAAIDYVAWAMDKARLAVLDAIDARADAGERAEATSG
jgi:hypothetical protein